MGIHYGSWVDSSPAVVDGVVYFGSNDGKFYALDANTGHELWEFFTPYVINSSLCGCRRGSLFWRKMITVFMQ